MARHAARSRHRTPLQLGVIGAQRRRRHRVRRPRRRHHVDAGNGARDPPDRAGHAARGRRDGRGRRRRRRTSSSSAPTPPTACPTTTPFASGATTACAPTRSCSCGSIPRPEQAALLSLPRDLYVPIAGTRGSARINSAIQGGPARLVATITDALDLPIHHYVEIDFQGFRDLVDAVGGVPVYFPEPVRDTQLAARRPRGRLHHPRSRAGARLRPVPGLRGAPTTGAGSSTAPATSAASAGSRTSSAAPCTGLPAGRPQPGRARRPRRGRHRGDHDRRRPDAGATCSSSGSGSAPSTPTRSSPTRCPVFDDVRRRRRGARDSTPTRAQPILDVFRGADPDRRGGRQHRRARSRTGRRQAALGEDGGRRAPWPRLRRAARQRRRRRRRSTSPRPPCSTARARRSGPRSSPAPLAADPLVEEGDFVVGADVTLVIGARLAGDVADAPAGDAGPRPHDDDDGVAGHDDGTAHRAGRRRLRRARSPPRPRASAVEGGRPDLT